MDEAEVQEESTVARKLPDAVIKRPEEQRLLGLIDSDDEDGFAAIFSDSERVFSQTKRVIRDDRKRLSTTTIEGVQCQRNWLAQKAVHSDLEAVIRGSRDLR